MMKRIFIITLILMLVFISTSNIYAQELKIIDVKGRVLLRQREVLPWRKARAGEVLYKDYELLTKKNSECTLGFDSELNKTLTLKENSKVKIADVLRVSIELTRGRVFSLIERKEKEEVFEIKTPVAIAGPRGTGWSVGFIGGIASALCYEGAIYIKGLDKEGNIISQEDIEEGFGVEVDREGMIGDLFMLRDEETREWNEFRDELRDLQRMDEAESERPVDRGGDELGEELEEIRDEQRDDFREEVIRELRQPLETGTTESTQEETSSSGDEQEQEPRD